MKVFIDVPFDSTEIGQVHNWFTPLQNLAGLADYGIELCPLHEAEVLVCYEFNYADYAGIPVPKVYMYGHDEAAILWESRTRVLSDPLVKAIACPNCYRNPTEQMVEHYENTRHGAITYAYCPDYERPDLYLHAESQPVALPSIDLSLLSKVHVLGSMMWQDFYGYVTDLDHCERSRPIDINLLGNMGQYNRWSVRKHRYDAVRAVHALNPSLTKLVSGSRCFTKEAHFASLRQSKIVLAPWGYGETTARDFQGVLAGAVVIKPYSQYIKTNPDFYDGSWSTIHWCEPDYKNLAGVVEDILTNWTSRWAYQVEAQQQRMAAVRANDTMLRDFAMMIKQAI